LGSSEPAHELLTTRPKSYRGAMHTNSHYTQHTQTLAAPQQRSKSQAAGEVSKGAGHASKGIAEAAASSSACKVAHCAVKGISDGSLQYSFC
jgi:hypothetical protein